LWHPAREVRSVDALSELQTSFGDALVIDPEIMETYRRDRAPWAASELPLAVARPTHTTQVQELARWSTRHHIALVARGAGTGISGGASALAGSVVVSFERMQQIIAIDDAAMLAVVQPGVLNETLKLAAEVHGLWYPPDPSSFAISTLGGNVATNAGGLCCVKYGVTADYVLGLEVVLADGTLLRTGGKTRKNVAGYDLTHLLVGSEGTLALITEITLRLRRRPPPARTLVAMFDTLEASGCAVSSIVRTADASLLEIMDRASLQAVEKHAKLDLDTSAAAMLIAQTDAPSATEAERMLAACAEAGSTFTALAEDEAEGRMLLAARRLAYPALEQLGDVLVDDIAVPVSLLSEMLQKIAALAQRSGALIATVAHAGDGNLHPLIVFDRRDPADEARAVRTFEALMTEAIELGGTITGEHGVGTLKRDFLPRQLGAASIALHRRLKLAFDPLGLLNPGKLLTVQ
jgi:glycolate oxidase